MLLKRILTHPFIGFRTDELYGVLRRSRLLRNQPIERHHNTDMNTSLLRCIISCDYVLREGVLDVLAADQLPRIIPFFPCGLIVNTDISSRPGRHWVAFFIRDDNDIEFFDSYGQQPGIYNGLFMSWMHRHAKTVLVSGQHLQNDYSNVCGLYCVHFLHQRFLGVSMDQIFNSFSISDTEENDNYMLDLFSRVYPDCVRNGFVYNQICQPISFR